MTLRMMVRLFTISFPPQCRPDNLMDVCRLPYLRPVPRTIELL